MLGVDLVDPEKEFFNLAVAAVIRLSFTGIRTCFQLPPLIASRPCFKRNQKLFTDDNQEHDERRDSGA